MPKPMLSIGIIFKNEIRCLERCLKSLTPLREAVSCELVMADTGSNDGSRELAAQYADILFDFPWVNDFSAARNAVMDRCSGEWFFFLDCDEWLGEDIRQLTGILSVVPAAVDAGAVTVRNYRSYDEAERDEYADSMPIRLLHMSVGLRFEGVIHESWVITREHRVANLERVILHHDGYVCFNDGTGAEKRARNVSLLRQTLSQAPDDLRRLQEYIEAADGESDYLDAVRRSIHLVNEKRPGWDRFGAPIYRNAVFAAQDNGLPEVDDWICKAEELFPDAYVTRLDVGHIAFGRAVERKNRQDYIRRGERWLAAVADYRAGRGNRVGLLYAALRSATPGCEAYVRMFTAYGYLMEKQPERALELLESLDAARMPANQVEQTVMISGQLHAVTELDTAPLLINFWKQINQPIPNEDRAKQRREAFLKAGTKTFLPEYLQAEDAKVVLHHAYTLFAPLAYQCVLGTAAAILETEDVSEKEKLLNTVGDWNEFPILALQNALLSGIHFPLLNHPLKLEEMDILAGQLGEAAEELAAQIVECDFTSDRQSLTWVRALALAAVQNCKWENEQLGLTLARTFARVEQEFLPRYYAPELLCEENIRLLPPMHRFGWYCAQAFEALDAGDTVKYVQLLQKGLAANPGMKPMAEFLTDHTPQLQQPKPSGELLALAEQVRTILFAYPPDDPAVEALKASPAYQKVAHLIEGPELSVYGGLAQ